MSQVWTGPREEDLAPDGLSLRGPVPPERWPCGPPDHHEACCRLHRMADRGIGKLYCDCRASDASDMDYGVGHWPGRRTVDDPARAQGPQAAHEPRHETSVFRVGDHWEWSCSCGAPSNGTKRVGIERFVRNLAASHVRNAKYRAKARARRLAGPANQETEMGEDEIDAMANDGRLGVIAKRLAIEDGLDWPSLDDDAQDEWHERAIAMLRSGSAKAVQYARETAP